MAMKTTALIMAGGRGERFWPKSRRILPLVAPEDIYIATNRDYKALVR